MSRPRLDSEQKKVSFSLAFSPNLIAALEKVRGAKSQSVFVEEWLRQNHQIAAELAAMNDPGFAPPKGAIACPLIRLRHGETGPAAGRGSGGAGKGRLARKSVPHRPTRRILVHP